MQIFSTFFEKFLSYIKLSFIFLKLNFIWKRNLPEKRTKKSEFQKEFLPKFLEQNSENKNF